MTMQDVQTLIDESKLDKDDLWERIEAFTELEYWEFEEMWQKKPARVTKQ